MAIKFVRKLETVFEKYIEGFFNKKFSSGLQPLEIAKKLLADMEAGRSVGVHTIYIPSGYTVYLHTSDQQRMLSGESEQELRGYLQAAAEQKGYTFDNELTVSFVVDSELEPGQFKTACQPVADQPAAVPALSVDANTRVFQKLAIETGEQKVAAVTAQLRVIDGPDTGKCVEAARQRVNFGRREGNECALTDLNVSRLHAYISCEQGQHVLYDAKSLNGTYVNGQRIQQKQLLTGDRIKLGNTVVLYEVK